MVRLASLPGVAAEIIVMCCIFLSSSPFSLNPIAELRAGDWFLPPPSLCLPSATPACFFSFSPIKLRRKPALVPSFSQGERAHPSFFLPHEKGGIDLLLFDFLIVRMREGLAFPFLPPLPSQMQCFTGRTLLSQQDRTRLPPPLFREESAFFPPLSKTWSC